ncbi:unnamed protein product [Gordionus sp. m RMFG-2023]
MIGGLFPIFLPSRLEDDKCTDEFMMGQALIVYSLVFAMHKINAYSYLLKNVDLGLDIKPTCNDPVIALIESIKFIDQGESTNDSYNLKTFESEFNYDASKVIFGEIQERSKAKKTTPSSTQSNVTLIKRSRYFREAPGVSHDNTSAFDREHVSQWFSESDYVIDESKGFSPQRHYIFKDIRDHHLKINSIDDIYKSRNKRQNRIENGNILSLSNLLTTTTKVISFSTANDNLNNSISNRITASNTPLVIFDKNLDRSKSEISSLHQDYSYTPSIGSTNYYGSITSKAFSSMDMDDKFFDPNMNTISDQERITLQATLNFMNKEPKIKALVEGLGNAAKIISPLLSSYQIPQISYKNSDDNLGNKMFYPYLIRFAVSNQIYVEAVVELLTYYNWNYVNVLYQDDDNSENLYELLKVKLAKVNMCTFVETRLDETDDSMPAKLNNFTSAIFREKILFKRAEDFNSSLVNDTKLPQAKEIKAKIVITFLTEEKIINMFKYFDSISSPNNFFVKDLIFIGVYSWPSPLLMEFEGLANRLPQISSLFFREIQGKITDYLMWFRSVAVRLYAQEPLMKSYNDWKERVLTNRTDIIMNRYMSQYNASSQNRSNVTLADRQNMFIWEMEEEMFGLEIYQIIEAMQMLAQVFDKLRWRDCPDASNEEIRDCLKGDDIYNGLINILEEQRFGLEDEGHRTLILKNVRNSQANLLDFNEVEVGFFYKKTLIITREIRLLNISFSTQAGAPLSLCSIECSSKQYKIYKSNLCCWECAKCQVNEILTSNKDKPCALCPKFSWPNIETQSVCLEIVPKTLQSYTFSYYVIPVLQIIGLFGWAIIMIFYLHNFNHPIAQEMGRLIIILLIIGTFLGLIAHFNYFGYPATAKCTTAYFLKYASAVLYCAAILGELSTSKSFVMRNRDMVDIFRNELTSYEKRRQYIVAIAVIALQVIFSILLYIRFPIIPAKEQVSDTLNEVLMYCPVKTRNTPFNIVQISYLIILLLISIYLISREQSLLRISSALRYLSFCIYISLFLCVMMLPINFSMKSFLSRIMFDFVLFIILDMVFLIFIADFAIFRLYTLKTYNSGQAGGSVFANVVNANTIHKLTSVTPFGGINLKKK